MIRRMVFDLDGPLPNSMFVRNPAGGASLPSVSKTPAGEPAGKDTHLYCCMAARCPVEAALVRCEKTASFPELCLRGGRHRFAVIP